MPSKVVVRDLKKHYGGIEAARGVSFDIAEGEIFGLLGPNGAGKTTTVECIIGLREPDAGTVEVCGIDARTRPREVKQKIGAALQTTELQDKITPREALGLFGAFYRIHARPGELLERFGLTDKADAPFDSLSSGQRQRLALALAFVNDPELVFLDEPTTGLDAQSRRDLHAKILQMKQDGHTVLLTTHYMDEAESLCDRIAVIDKGRIVASGRTHELIAASCAPPHVSVTTSRPLDVAGFGRIDGISDIEANGATVTFRAPDPNQAVADLVKVLDVQAATIVELHVQKASLEDVFLELTGAGDASR
jgi:ABC-2 type transport system ATP-binding protein